MRDIFDRSDPQVVIGQAFAKGLRSTLGEPLGELLADAALFTPRVTLTAPKLQAKIDGDSGAILNAVVGHRVNGATLCLIRDNMIASALLGDIEGVRRWATEGLSHASHAGEGWEESGAQWSWVLSNPERYRHYVREVKTFMHQL